MIPQLPCVYLSPRAKLVVASGHFSPLHAGHILYLEEAKKLGDHLVVIVNNDAQVSLKGSVPFMSGRERCAIIGALRCVDSVLLSWDKDRTVNRTLAFVHNSCCRVSIFANGGDVNESDVRERETCERLGIQIVCGVGGREKIQSSSQLIQRIASSDVYSQSRTIM